MIYVLMGVSGAGKTLIGQKLAHELQLPFYDGDDFHPAANRKKMASGHPLNDDDRRPWLELLSQKIQQWHREGGAVLACSALKKTYRDLLKNPDEDSVHFIYLKGPMSLIESRLSMRSDHFMPDELLKSQFETLEEPQKAITVSVDQSPDKVVKSILSRIAPPEK